MEIETIKISDNGRRGFKVINKSDFIEGKHKIFSDKAIAKPKAKTRKTKED